MEKVLQSLKNLYKGEEIFKRHLGIMGLLFLPALLGGVVGFIDKETPKEVMVVLGIAALVLVFLCIVPFFFLSGVFIKFVKDRLNSIAGIPKITSDTFVEGLKVFPLQIVWSLYLLVIFGFLMCIFIVPLVMMLSQGSKPEMGSVLLFIGGLLLFFLLMMLFFILVCPFLNYIYIDYVKQGRLCGYLFNPLKLFDYMKKAFKDTILVFVKFWLVAIVGSLMTGIVQVIFILFAAGIGVLAVLTSGESNSDMAIYSPVWATILIFISSIVVLLNAYVTTMISYAASENYIGVYKDKIEVQ